MSLGLVGSTNHCAVSTPVAILVPTITGVLHPPAPAHPYSESVLFALIQPSTPPDIGARGKPARASIYRGTDDALPTR